MSLLSQSRSLSAPDLGCWQVGVFKPVDGEPAAELNPKRRGRDAEREEPLLKKGVLPGEGAVREVAVCITFSVRCLS